MGKKLAAKTVTIVNPLHVDMDVVLDKVPNAKGEATSIRVTPSKDTRMVKYFRLKSGTDAGKVAEAFGSRKMIVILADADSVRIA